VTRTDALIIAAAVIIALVAMCVWLVWLVPSYA
jgi:hypothetical protein